MLNLLALLCLALILGALFAVLSDLSIGRDLVRLWRNLTARRVPVKVAKRTGRAAHHSHPDTPHDPLRDPSRDGPPPWPSGDPWAR